MNFDPRSVSLNCEMGIKFEHSDLVGEIQRVFADQASPQSSYRLRLDETGLGWDDLSGGKMRILREEPAASARRRLISTIVGLLPIESQL